MAKVLGKIPDIRQRLDTEFDIQPDKKYLAENLVGY